MKYADNTVIPRLVENYCEISHLDATGYAIQWWKVNHLDQNIPKTKEIIHYFRKTPSIKAQQ